VRLGACVVDRAARPRYGARVTPLEIAFEDERAVMGTVRNVAFVGWREAPLVAHVREWHRLGRNIAKAHPGAGACIDIVLRGTPKFGEDVRKEAIRMASDRHVFELGFAHAILVPGFTGTAVRAFIGTVLLVARPAAPTKVFGDVTSAVHWLAPSLAPHGWKEADLRAACDDVVARLARVV